MLLDYTPWSEWLLSDRISPLYFRSDAPAELRSGPAATSQLLAEISGDHIVEPLEVRGEWMRVVVKQPSDYGRWDMEVVRREGWVRWYSAETGPRVWYPSPPGSDGVRSGPGVATPHQGPKAIRTRWSSPSTSFTCRSPRGSYEDPEFREAHV